MADFTNGYFAVDAAGVNGHASTVSVLVDDYIKNVKSLLANEGMKPETKTSPYT